MVTRRFDVFPNPSPRSARSIPYVVVLQSDLLDEMPSQVVAPLIRVSALANRPATRLNPRFEIEGTAVCLLTQQIGAVAASSLTRRVGSLEEHRELVVAALDFLFGGI